MSANDDQFEKTVNAHGSCAPSAGSAIAGYKLPCPWCIPRWTVAVTSKRRGFDHREFYRGTCSRCGWRVVKMILPNP